MYTKEQIISEIRRVVETLGVNYLEQKDFEKNSTIPMSTIRYFLGSWKQAIEEAGLNAPDASKKLEEVDEEKLLLDLIRLHKEYGETPSLMLIKKKGKYNERLYATKWNTVSDAFRRARRKYPHKFATPGPSLKTEENYNDRLDTVLDDYEKTDEINPVSMNNGKDPLDFEGLLYNDGGDKPKEKITKKVPPSKKKVAKEKKADPSDEMIAGVDPNEITQVHSAKKIFEETTRKNKKKAEKIDSRKPKKDNLDFSDIGLDVVNVGAGEEAPEGNGDNVSDKTIVIDSDSKDAPQPEMTNFETINFQPPKGKNDTGVMGAMYIPQTIKPQKDKMKRKSAAELLNFRGLRYAPINQQGVLFIFGMISHELGFLIESVKSGFPTAEGRRCVNRDEDQWEHVRLQLEFKSSYFREMGHDDNECDLIVCWNHDWDDCPLEVLELRSIIKYLEDNTNS